MYWAKAIQRTYSPPSDLPKSNPTFPSALTSQLLFYPSAKTSLVAMRDLFRIDEADINAWAKPAKNPELLACVDTAPYIPDKILLFKVRIVMTNQNPFIIGILDKFWIAWQRLPKEIGRLAKLFITGKRIMHGAPNIINPAGDANKIKAMI